MTVGVLSLAGFLLARIAEDEADAQDALERGFGGWEWLADAGINFEARTHIVRHHPARVLAECEAKRRIVERCRWAEADPKAAGDMDVAGQWEDAMDTLYDLASVYAGHPDYRDEWKP